MLKLKNLYGVFVLLVATMLCSCAAGGVIDASEEMHNNLGEHNITVEDNIVEISRSELCELTDTIPDCDLKSQYSEALDKFQFTYKISAQSLLERMHINIDSGEFMGVADDANAKLTVEYEGGSILVSSSKKQNEIL